MKVRRGDINAAFRRIQLIRRRAVHRAGRRLGIKPFNRDGTWRWLQPVEIVKLEAETQMAREAQRILQGLDQFEPIGDEQEARPARASEILDTGAMGVLK